MGAPGLNRPAGTLFGPPGGIYGPPQPDPLVPFPAEPLTMKKPSGPRTGDSARSPVEIAAVEQLAKLAVKYDLTEVDINLGELRVRLGRARAQTAPPVLAPAPAQAPANAAEPSAHAAVEGGPPAADLAGTVKSPMVGTAYLRPSPDAKPFVEVGTVVKEGDRIEARLPHRTVSVYMSGKDSADVSVPVSGSYFSSDLLQPLGLSTGKARSIDDIQAVLERERRAYQQSVARFRDHSPVVDAIQTVIG